MTISIIARSSDNYKERNKIRSKELISKVKQKRLRSITLQEAIEESPKCYPHVGPMNN